MSAFHNSDLRLKSQGRKGFSAINRNQIQKDRKQMKQEQFAKMIEDGAIFVKGTYWSGRVEKISMRSLTPGGARREGHVIRETILTESDSIVISRFMRDDENVESWKPSAKKMDKVVCRIRSMKVDNGNIILDGTIETLI